MNLNLLPSRAKFQMARMHARGLVRKIILYTVIGWVAMVAVLLVVWFGFNLDLKNANKKNKGAQADYAALGDYAITSLQLKYRAKIVGKLLNGRFEYGEVLEKIKKFFPPEVELENFELEPPKAFTIEGKCKSSACMTEVEKRVKEISNGESEDFTSVQFTDLGWKEGVFSFSLEVIIK